MSASRLIGGMAVRGVAVRGVAERNSRSRKDCSFRIRGEEVEERRVTPLREVAWASVQIGKGQCELARLPYVDLLSCMVAGGKSDLSPFGTLR